MKNLMLDIETLGYRKNACIIQIGACYFDPQTGDILDSFSRNIDARSSTGEIDADTVYFWLNQSRDAINLVTEAPLYTEKDALDDFRRFAHKAEQIWSHATFDFVIIQEALMRHRIPRFNYKLARDIRTLVDLSGVNLKDFQRLGTHHNALDDCLYQVKYCHHALKVLKK